MFMLNAFTYILYNTISEGEGGLIELYTPFGLS